MLRQCLAIREKSEPDTWTTFNNRILRASVRQHQAVKTKLLTESCGSCPLSDDCRRIPRSGPIPEQILSRGSDDDTHRVADLVGARARNGRHFRVGGPQQARIRGAVRANNHCIECHGCRRGDLLGAFSYSLGRAAPPGSASGE